MKSGEIRMSTQLHRGHKNKTREGLWYSLKKKKTPRLDYIGGSHSLARGEQRKGGVHLFVLRLLAEAEAADRLFVLLWVRLFEVLHEPRPLPQKHSQPPLARVVLLVDEKVRSEALDALGEERDLEGGGASVIGAHLELRHGLVVEVGAGHLARRHHLQALRTLRHRASCHRDRNRSTAHSRLEPCCVAKGVRGGEGCIVSVTSRN